MPSRPDPFSPLLHPTPAHATGVQAAAPIRVFIAEDHAITLWGLQRLIDGMAPRMQVVGTASHRAALLAHPAAVTADVILLDLDLAGEDCAESLGDLLRRSAGHVLVLTADDDLDKHRRVVMGGARGVVHKSEPAPTILTAIEKVHQGEVWLNRNLLGQVLGQLTGRAPAPRPDDVHGQRIASLTPREREIIATLVRLRGAKQLALALELGMSENTLRNHLTSIYAKLDVRGRLELHVYATEHGLAELPPRPA